MRSLVVAAGLEISRPEPAIGKDFYIGFPGPRETIKSPRILVSVRSWRTPVLGDDDCWHYNLTIANYNFLARSTDLRPFLFLAIVPAVRTDYSLAAHDGLLLRTAVYWLSFEDIVPLRSGTGTTRIVIIPRIQLLTVESLVALVEGNELELMGAR